MFWLGFLSGVGFVLLVLAVFVQGMYRAADDNYRRQVSGYGLVPDRKID